MILYHYCSNAAFLSIISTRSIWLSEFSLSNDLLEGRWIRTVFSASCDEHNIPAIEKEGVLGMLDVIISFLGAAGFCMSEEPDLLSQWRAYSDNACGVSIGFNSDYLNDLGTIKRDRGDEFNLSLSKVEYTIESQKELIEQPMSFILERTGKGAFEALTLLTHTQEAEEQRKQAYGSLSMAVFLLFPFLHQFKNPAFQEEREWRLISFVTPNESTGGMDMHRMDFRPLTDRIVPYRAIKLENNDFNPILEVVLGPRNITPEHVVRAALIRHGWKDVNVRRSSASYR
jgi:hypothetical protein